MEGPKNLENKDEFWIQLNEQIQIRQGNNTFEPESFDIISDILNNKNFKGRYSSPEKFVNIDGIKSNSLDRRNRFGDVFLNEKSSNQCHSDQDKYSDLENISDNLSSSQKDQLQKQLTTEEKEKIKKMIEAEEDSHSENYDIDNYLQNLEGNDSD